MLARALALLAFVLCCAGARAALADPDPRVEARTHYQAGQKAYSSGDYQAAIREFAAAEQLVPSGYNDYNLGLCYDKLGEADPAVKYYRSYLSRVADAKNRASVEASIVRLEAAMSSAQSKEQVRLDAAKRAAEEAAARAAEAEAKRAAEEEAKRAAEAAASEAARRAAEAAPAGDDKRDPVVSGEVAPTPPGPTATPPVATSAATPTGNAQLDRVNAIQLDTIRAERAPLLGAAPARADGTTPAVAGASARDASGKPVAPVGTQAVKAESSHAEQAPLYKKWWFWAIVGVSAYVVYNIATQDRTQTSARLAPDAPTGATLFSW